MSTAALMGCQQIAPAPAGPVAVVVAPPSIGGTPSYVGLFSEEEFQLLRQLHSAPGTDTRLTDGVHVQLLSADEEVVLMDFGAGGQLPHFFRHVRVLDGPARGKDGWIVDQQLKLPAGTPTPNGR